MTRRTKTQVETGRMERARDLLQQIVLDLRQHKAVTPESVAMTTSALLTIAMLEHEIGRRLTGTIKEWERAPVTTVLAMIPAEWISKADRERVDLAQRRTLNREGYFARKVGVRECPKFVDPDMGIYWQIGWNEADR